jgi:hypothetical protein
MISINLTFGNDPPKIIELPDDATVLHLKEFIHEQSGILTTELNVIRTGKVMKDSELLGPLPVDPGTNHISIKMMPARQLRKFSLALASCYLCCKP